MALHHVAKKGVKNTWKVFFTPKTFTFFLLLPMMVIMPLVISSLTLGFPVPYIITNNEAASFGDVFDKIQLPEQTRSVSKTKVKVGNFIDNIKNEKEKADNETSLSVSYTIKKDNDIDTDIYNGCDYLAIKVIQSELPQDELSKKILEEFSNKINDEKEKDVYKLVYASQLKLMPVNKESLVYTIENADIDFKKDFNITSSDIIEGQTYLLVMINDNVNKYPDPRCK